tara:strand:- start:1709 stop:2083 length:375 start_codon:yes stop_codon:yes gene_type:complete
MKKLLTEWREYLKEETIPMGQCFPFAVKMAQASSNEEFEDLSLFKVVHGEITVSERGKTKTIQHAWVEKPGLVFDEQTSYTKPDGVPRDVWYAEYQPNEGKSKEYTAEEAMLTCVRQGQMGPWD